MENNKTWKYLTYGAIGLAIIHMFWPSLGIDSITITLLIIAVLPWLLPLLKTVELPGGVKIELKDTKAATDKVTDELKEKIKGKGIKKTDDSLVSLRHVAEHDPNLALVGFRIEVEKRLLALAEINNIRTERKSLSFVVRMLEKNQLLPKSAASGLMELIALGNRAAHGAKVSPDAASWVIDVGPEILSAFDESNEE